MKIPDDLKSLVPCRERELGLLLNIFGHHHEPAPPSLVLCGCKSSGKSFTISQVLQFLNIAYAKVDCVEGYLPRLLFESIIKQLFGDISETKCEDMMEFINQLNQAAQNEVFSSRTNVIILERSERLRDMSPNLLPALLRLNELCMLKHVCVVLTSSIVWEKHVPPGGLIPPLQVFFYQYSQADIVQILSLEKPKECSTDFYQRYLDLLVKVFFKYCCDLCELRYKASILFPIYYEPVKSGTLQPNDSAGLFKHILPVLRSSIKTLYLRIDRESKASFDYSGSSVEPVEKKQSLSSSAKCALSFELPYYAKYLLIAAYLASYNSSKEDKKLFVKLTDKTRKKTKRNHVVSKLETNSLMMGPKHFDLERLLAIFFSIVEEKPHVSVNLLSQVSTLVELRLLSKVGTDPLECPKYKCIVGFDFIVNISKTVGFAVIKYLVCFK